ncbi:MAG: TetR/AcrR family transcriptional regulator [Acidimicrobiia bacterium]
MDRDDSATAAERDRLIAAAWSILERTDFAGLKVKRVATQAGVSMRAFYRHFADKDGLLLVLICEEMQRSAPRLARVVERVVGPEARVRAWIAALIGAAADPARVHRAHLFTELTPVLGRRHRGALEEAERALWRPLLDAIEAGYREGTFRGGDPAVDARLVYDLAGARLGSALTVDDPASVDEIIEATMSFVMRALSGGPPRPPVH